MTEATRIEGAPPSYDGAAKAHPVHGGFPVQLHRFAVTVAQGDLASAASKTLIPAIAGAQWRIYDIWIDGSGTNFSGGGGDRLMAIQDSSGTVIATTIPAASLQTLVSAKLGSTAVPIADVSHPRVTTAGEAVVAKYSGGSADYSAGSVPVVIIAERVA